MTYAVLALSGSLRSASSNTGLVRMAQRLAPPSLDITFLDTLRDVPFYDADLDVPEHVPPAAAALRAAVTAADAILLAAPEYNWGASAVLKNAFDWASRPMGAQALRGKIVAVVSSGGKGGGAKVTAYFNEVLGLFGNTMVTEPPVNVAMGMTLVHADGTTTDPSIEQLMRDRLANLVAALDARTAG